MELIKKLGFRILILSIFALILSQIYSRYIFEKDLLEHAPLYENIRDFNDTCKITYLSESSNFSNVKTDNDRRSISAFTSDYFSHITICPIAQGALHGAHFLTILQNLEDKDSLETVIVVLNLRSFGADWIHSKLETSLQKQMLLLNPGIPLINRIKLSFRAYDIKTDTERQLDIFKDWEAPFSSLPTNFPYQCTRDWDKGRANGSILKEDGSWDMEKIELSCHFVKNYAFEIDTNNNPRIKDFDAIVKLAKKNNWKLIFNLLAENTEQAAELVEPELLWLMKQNRDLLVNRYTQKGVIVVDNLDNVTDSLFTDREWPTEHYAEQGRKIIAKNLADSLKVIYSEKYKVIP